MTELIAGGIDEELIREGFEREVLRSERARATIIACLFAFASCFFPAVLFFRPDLVIEVFGGYGVVPRIFLFLGGTAAYGFAARYHLGRLAARRAVLSNSLRYFNAFVEISIPTGIMILMSSFIQREYILVTPGVLLYFVFIILSALRLEPKLCLFTGGVAALEYLALAWWFVLRHAPEGIPPVIVHPMPNLSRAGIIFLGGVATALLTAEIRRHIRETLDALEARRRVVDIFGKHVSPAVVEKLLEQRAGLEGEIRHVCIMFIDIRGFTTFSEGKAPADVVSYLNDLFEFMVESINRHEGIVNKFLGDGLMAVFGAPISSGRDTRSAVNAAIEIHARVGGLVREGRIPPTKIGIGIHSGPAMTGSIGSSERKEYTIIGDVVNVASRIEQMNKELGTEILFSHEVKQELGSSDLRLKSFADVKLKGREETVLLWTVEGLS
ncbi:MAG: adenylate/guanylate cyclase domain-containing protein [Candidatus Hydrogenedentota bacterium]